MFGMERLVPLISCEEEDDDDDDDDSRTLGKIFA